MLDKKMPQDNDIIFKVKSLNKEERRILAQKVGMEKFNLNPQNKKIIETFLDVLRKLKKLDREQLFKLAQKLGIEISSDEKEPVNRILEKGELGEIGKKLNIKRVILVRGLSFALIIVFIVIFFARTPSQNLILYGFGIEWLIAGWLGSIASIVGFFLVFSPDAEWKERIIGCWTTNRLDLIFILMSYIIFNHPAPLFLVALMGGAGSIGSVILTFVNKQALDNWRNKNFYKLYYTIIALLIGTLLYIDFFIIAGKVCYDDNRNDTINNADVEVVSDPESPDWWICNYSKLIKEGSWLYEAIGDTNFCSTKTNDKGRFLLRLWPDLLPDKDSKYAKIKATDGTHESGNISFYSGKLGKKDIEIPIKRKLLEGKWQCSVKSSSFFEWKIEEEGHAVIIIKGSGDLPPEPYNFEKKEFLRFSYPKGLLLKEKANTKPLNIKIILNKNKLSIVETMGFEIFSCIQSN